MRGGLLALIALLPLFLGACGGGSGRVQPAPAPPPPPQSMPAPAPRCEINTADLGCVSMARYEQERDRIIGRIEQNPAYQEHWGYRQTGIARAWAQLQLQHGAAAARPGAGVGIGIIDDGIRQQHPAFRHAGITESFYGGASEASTLITATARGANTRSHGSRVASVIVAQGGTGLPGDFLGVAPGADLHMFTIPSPSDGGISPWEHYQQIVEQALRENVDIFSFSFSSAVSIDQFNDRSELFAVVPLDIDDAFLYVASGGNNRELTSVSAIAGLPVLVPELRDNYVAVVGADAGGALRSAPCGIAADWCIAAPARSVPAAYYGHSTTGGGAAVAVIEGFRRTSGTSLATPYVAGVLALVKHAFRDQLSDAEIVQRMYATADKSGRYADRSQYGQGLVDAGAATAPAGRLLVSGGNAPAIGPAQSSLSLGQAFGDGLSRRLARQEIAAFDSLNAPFFLPLADFYRPRAASPAAPLRRPGFHTAAPPGPRLQIHDPFPGGDGGYLALSDNAARLRLPGRDNLAVTAFASMTRPGQPTMAGAELDWTAAPGSLRLKGGWLVERNGLLGGRQNNPYGRAAADTFYAGIAAARDWRGWRLGGRLEAGYTRPVVRDSLVSGFSGLVTSAFSLHADRELAAGHRLRLAVQQPVRVEAGQVRLLIPSGRRRDGARTYRRLVSDATPSGRRLDLTLRLNGEGRPLPRRGAYYYDLALTYSRHPWHSRDRGGDLRMQAGLGLRY